MRPSPLPNAVKCRKVKKSVKISEDSLGKSLMPPTFFGCLPRQKIDQKRHLSSRLSRIHSTHASLAGRDQSRDDASRGRKHFNPRVPCGTRQKWRFCNGPARDFNPRVPCGTRPERDRLCLLRTCDFNPRVPCGTRRVQIIQGDKDLAPFQPTRPLRDATMEHVGLYIGGGISTHASLAGRDEMSTRGIKLKSISTHASLAGRDGGRCAHRRRRRHFNPRVPCGTRR